MHILSYRRLALLTALAPLLGLMLTTHGQESGDRKWIAPAAESQRKNPLPPDETSIAAGYKVYSRRCLSCHGSTGNGDGPDAIDLGIHPAKFSDPNLKDQPDGALFWKITVGRKPMPDYGRKLSPAERWNVINYLRTLNRR
jgi:mono/diheme cytochrome c family protein